MSRGETTASSAGEGLRVLVLGSAAGGGFPQWNCACPHCARARSGDPAAGHRTQTGLAVSADGERWVLLNASPDLRQQIEASPALHPRGMPRGSPIAAVLLTGAEIDAVVGLLTLREGHAFNLYGTSETLALLDANPVFGALPPGRVPRCVCALNEPMLLRDTAGTPLGLSAMLFAVPGKVPLYAERSDDPGVSEDGKTIGVEIGAPAGPTLFFIPGCAALSSSLRDRLHGAHAVLFDGTLWRDDEMIRAGAGAKTGRRMGHMSLSGPDGTLAAFKGFPVRRKILIHINNTNPVLLDGSVEHAAARAAGWEVAWDGMEIRL